MRRISALALALACLLAELLAGAVSAHTTFLPHHGQDFEDMATGRDKRGVVLLVTLGFLSGLVALGAFVFKQSKTPAVTEDTRAAQRRLREALIQVAASVRPTLGRPEPDVLRAVVNAYARAVHAPPPLASGASFRIGSDLVAVRYEPPSLEIVAYSETGGAHVALSERGDFTIGTFIAGAEHSGQS
jgi:hypothetical protein